MIRFETGISESCQLVQYMINGMVRFLSLMYTFSLFDFSKKVYESRAQ